MKSIRLSRRQGRRIQTAGILVAAALTYGCSGSDSSDAPIDTIGGTGGTSIEHRVEGGSAAYSRTGTNGGATSGHPASGGSAPSGATTSGGDTARGGGVSASGTAATLGGRSGMGGAPAVTGLGGTDSGKSSATSRTTSTTTSSNGGASGSGVSGGGKPSGGASSSGGLVVPGGATSKASNIGGSRANAGGTNAGGTNAGGTNARGGSAATGGASSGCYATPAAEIGTQARASTVSGYGTVAVWAKTPHQIVRLQTTMVVPPKPPATGTLFLWPGLQPYGANFDPIDNGVLQPVLTWGPACAPIAQPRAYSTWWISGQYVNTNGSVPGYTDCNSGPAMSVSVCDRLEIELALSGTVWRQTVIDAQTNQSVTYDIDMQNQSQNLAYFVIEEYSSTPVSEVIFTDTTITFDTPDAADCQVYMRGQADFVSTPTASSDGLRCSIPQIILRAQGIQ